MRERLRIIARGFEEDVLQPLFHNAHFEQCWPRCAMIVRNFKD